MKRLDDLERDEFVQNYLQYRWLDDTRTKFIDRFFVVLLAVLVARFQFTMFLDDHLGWRAVLYGLFVVTATFMAKSIVTFRRQQRGHWLYINAIHKRLLACDKKHGKYSEYGTYVFGKPVYITLWIECIVVIIATLSPLLFVEIAHDISLETAWLDIVVIGTIFFTAVAIALFVLVPFVRYNRDKALDWKKG